MTDKKDNSVAVFLSIVFVVGLLVWFLSSTTDSPNPLPKQALIDTAAESDAYAKSCVDAAKKYKLNPVDRPYIEWFGQVDITKQLMGSNGCAVIACKIVKGWTKEGTYYPDTTNCSGDNGKILYFYLKK